MQRLTALQRGLGRGFRQTLESPAEAREEVLSCVLNDPRWDRQVDDRSSYYAQLLLAAPGSWQRVESCLEMFADSPELESLDRGLVLGVLAHAAWRGEDKARALLQQYSACALLLDDIRSSLYSAGDRELLAQVLGAAQLGWLDREKPEHTPEPPIGAATPPHQILPLLEQPSNRAVDVLNDRASTEDLLQYREQAGVHGFLKVMGLLGKRGCADLLEESIASLSQEDLPLVRRRAYQDYLQWLPANVTLALAREWVGQRLLQRAGLLVLRRWAEPGDRDLLEREGYRCLQDDDQRAVCTVVEALDRLRQPQSVPFLACVFEQLSYSYGRTFVIQALGKHRKRADVAGLLEEALWDSQPAVRAAAAGWAWNPARLRQLIADPFEDTSVLDAARKSLTAGAPWSAN